MNQVILIGNMTADPTTSKTQGGNSVAQFTLAVQRKYRNESGQHDADFIRCVAWRQTADYIGKYGAKGRRTAISGELQIRSYEKDGQRHTVCEVVANAVEFLDRREQAAAPDAPAAPGAPAAPETFTEDPDDDLPF